MVLLYTDNMVLFDETIVGLQDLLDTFHIYCSHWKLKVNHEEKSKVVILAIILDSFNDQTLEVVDCLNYLGDVLPKIKKFLSNQSAYC